MIWSMDWIWDSGVLGSFQLQQITTDLEPDEETLLRFLRGELRYKVKMLLLELDLP
jgi:hypothetical protein